MPLVCALLLAALPSGAQVRLVVPELPLSPAPAGLSLPAAMLSPSFSPGAAPLSLLAAPSLGAPPALLGAPAAAPAKAETRYERFFDGAAAPVDGAAVYPRLALGDGPVFREPLQVEAVRAASARALSVLRESVALGRWNGPDTTLDESCCGDAAPKLALLLRARGVPARLVEAEFHYYVILDLPDGQIVVDPTVRQFFGRKSAPKSVPQVFVGTIAELHALFKSHASIKTTKYDPSRIYFKDAVVREDALRKFEADVRKGGAADHEPLRAFLGFASPMLPPVERPLLIVP